MGNPTIWASEHKSACTCTEADWKLEISDDCTISVAKTKALICFAVTAKLICVFVFAYADCWFSYGAAHMIVCLFSKEPSTLQGVGQLCSSCTADQRLCIRSMDSTIPLPLKSEISSFLLFSLAGQALHGLCQTWSDRSPDSWFLMRMLI